MSDVFISYSRTDMTFAKRLHAGLEAGGLDAWIDWQDIPPSSDWLAEVFEAIEAADAFIFIISKESAGSEVCSHEVQHATENNKRLIPIVIDDIDPRQIPNSIAALNWIFFRESDDFNQAMKRLMEAIRIDQAWLKAHTRYQNRALEWERLSADPGFLLHGRDLEEAETWLTEASNKDPQPTALQAQFFQAGRLAQNRRSRRILIGASLALIITIALGLVAWTQRSTAVSASAVRATAQAAAIHEAEARATAESAALEEAAMRATAQAEAVFQRREADAQRITAQSRQLAAEAMIHLKPDEIGLALLLAVAGTQIEETQEARASLLRALLYRPHLSKLLYYDTRTYGVIQADTYLGYSNLAFSSDSKTLGGRSKLGSRELALTWDIETGRFLGETEIPPELANWELDDDFQTWGGYAIFDPNQTFLAAYDENQISVYDVNSKTLKYRLMDPYGSILSLTFNPQGTILASGDRIDYDQGKVLLWDMTNGQLLGDPLIGPEWMVTRLGFNTDGSMLVAIGRSRGDYSVYGKVQVHQWIIDKEGITPQEVIYLDEGSWNVFYDPYTGNIIAEDNGVVWTYSMATGEVQGRTFRMDPPHLIADQRMAMSPDGQYLAANCTYGRVFLYDLVDRISSFQAPLPDSSAASAIAYSPDGEELFVASCESYEEGSQTCSQSRVDRWDSKTFRLVQSAVHTQEGAIHSMFMREDGLLLTGRPTILSMSGSTDFTRRAYIHDTGALSLWDYQDSTSSTRILLLEPFSASDLAFSPDGSVLAVSGEDGLLLLSAEDGHELGRLWEDIPLGAIAYKSEGDRLFAGGVDGSLYAWDLAAGKLITEAPNSHNHPITGIAVQPDGNLLISVDSGGNLILWDRENLKPILEPIQADPTSIHTVAFDPAGDTFSIFSEMGVSIWQARLSAWQEKACQIANRDLTSEEWSLFLGDTPYQSVCFPGE